MSYRESKHLVGAIVLVSGLLLSQASCAAQVAPNAAPLVAQQKATLQPLNRTQFFVRPDQAETLSWRVQGEAANLTYEVRDYHEQVVVSRTAAVANGEVRVPLQVPAGFYEIIFQPDGQRFGVVALTAHQGASDKFFAIDAALSWLETRPEMRTDLVALLKRSGIGLVRERLSWGAVNPQPDQWDWETNRNFDTLRREYAKQEVQLLDLFHSSPGWAKIEASSPYPERLAETKQAWQAIAKHWQGNWNALEVWNEPDIGTGGELPADQYLPVVKTINYAFQEDRTSAKVGGGVFGYFNPAFIQNAVKNGLLDQVDFVSFHTYAKASSMEQIIRDYRRALTVAGQAPIPLWLTESGQPWKSGQARPKADEDAAIALDIVMKAVESRACGIAHYFAFVYPYYVEGAQNFGMMGQEVTPLRSMAAYTQTVATLSHTEYVGDLNIPAVQRARVFAQGDNAVVVLYSEKSAPGTSVAWTGPVGRLQGIDGRVLKLLPDGSIPLADGLTYVHTSLKSLSAVIQRQTSAAQLNALAKGVRATRPAASPIVLQPLLTATAPLTKRGYKVIDSSTASLPFRVRVNNLSNAPQQVDLTCIANGGAKLPERRIELAARATGEVQWDVNFAALLQQASAESVTLEVASKEQGGVAVSPLTVELFGERDLETYLKLYPASTKFDIADLPRWRPNISGNGQMSMNVVEGQTWQLKTTFKPGDRWVFPEFRLPENSGLPGSSGLILRARAFAPAVVRVMIKERSGATYFTPFSIVPPDKEWHSVILPWSDLAALPSAPPDANGKLDLDQITSISLGLNSKADDNTLEVSGLYAARK